MTRSPERPGLAADSFPFLLTHRRRAQGFREWLTPEISLTLLWIPPGRFLMGSSPDEPDRSAAAEVVVGLRI